MPIIVGGTDITAVVYVVVICIVALIASQLYSEGKLKLDFLFPQKDHNDSVVTENEYEPSVEPRINLLFNKDNKSKKSIKAVIKGHTDEQGIEHGKFVFDDGSFLQVKSNQIFKPFSFSDIWDNEINYEYSSKGAEDIMMSRIADLQEELKIRKLQGTSQKQKLQYMNKDIREQLEQEEEGRGATLRSRTPRGHISFEKPWSKKKDDEESSEYVDEEIEQ